MPKKSAYTPELNEYVVFRNKKNEFLATVTSFDPLHVNVHEVVSGVKTEKELSIESLDEYTIEPCENIWAYLDGNHS